MRISLCYFRFQSHQASLASPAFIICLLRRPWNYLSPTSVNHPYKNRGGTTTLSWHGGVTIGGREMRTATESDNLNKITKGKYIHGVVSCKDCMKPRCIYSVTSPNKMKPHPTDGASERHCCVVNTLSKNWSSPKITRCTCVACNHSTRMILCTGWSLLVKD